MYHLTPFCAHLKSITVNLKFAVIGITISRNQ